MMKKLVLLIAMLLSVGVSWAQNKDTLSEQEKIRRQKNIDAGNPFAKFGYKPKIATLSKGKYLEFHDLDSIVHIGSFTYNVRLKKIVGYTRLDTVHTEATLKPELISRWFSPDPLSDEFPSWSPYNFVKNSPIIRIDIDGRLDNPIYDTDGNFLGTDDKGLQGDAIVMDKSNFKQGMAHEEAENYNLGLDYLKHDVAAKENLQSHFSKLPERPDYHGVVTVEDANKWYSEGSGKPLYIDISKMKFLTSPVSVKDLTLGRTQEINFFNTIDIHPFTSRIKWRPASDHTLSRVYGTLRINLLDPKTGEIDLQRGFGGDPQAFDSYDFNSMDKIFQGKGTPFNFYGYNTGRVRIHPIGGINPLGGYMGSKL